MDSTKIYIYILEVVVDLPLMLLTGARNTYFVMWSRSLIMLKLLIKIFLKWILPVIAKCMTAQKLIMENLFSLIDLNLLKVIKREISCSEKS